MKAFLKFWIWNAVPLPPTFFFFSQNRAFRETFHFGAFSLIWDNLALKLWVHLIMNVAFVWKFVSTTRPPSLRSSLVRRAGVLPHPAEDKGCEFLLELQADFNYNPTSFLTKCCLPSQKLSSRELPWLLCQFWLSSQAPLGSRECRLHHQLNVIQPFGHGEWNTRFIVECSTEHSICASQMH